VEKVFQANGPHKEAGVAVFISDKVDLRLKSIRRDSGGHFILMTGTIHQEETSVLNVYALNTGAPIYLLKKNQKPNSNSPKSTDRH
jgi:hypothetical protein